MHRRRPEGCGAGQCRSSLPDRCGSPYKSVSVARFQGRGSDVAETVNVSGGTPIIETGRSQVSSTIGEAAVQNLPVNGRNVIDFALLTPGVTRDVRTGDISFAGQRGTLNSLVIDGADNNNTFFGQSVGRTGSGRAPYQFSQDAVKEFQVNSSSFAAEYGRAGGAVINVVTKPGTNQLRGSLFEFYRDKALNATNAINELNNAPKSPYHYNQFGGAVGGPIQRNRHFFFFNYDGRRNAQPNLVFLNLPATTSVTVTYLFVDGARPAAIDRSQPRSARLARVARRRIGRDASLDPRVARDIPIGPTRLRLIWEAFNLFNRDNINGVDATFYSVVGTTLTRSANFGRPLSSAGERIMQLAARLSF